MSGSGPKFGLITPPVGLTLFVIKGIGSDIPLHTILKGSSPYVLCMAPAILILCLVPGLVTWLPDLVMGPQL